MFNPQSAAEAIQTSQTAKELLRLEEAGRATQKLMPWFHGLAVCVEPYVLNPMPPKIMLHGHNPYACTWAMEILPAVGHPAVGALLLTQFVDQTQQVSFLTDLQFHTRGQDKKITDPIRTAIDAYARQTLGGEDNELVQTTTRYVKVPRG